MIREINIVAIGEEGPIELAAKFFARCEQDGFLPVKMEFGAIVAESKGKRKARMLLKGLADERKGGDVEKGGEGVKKAVSEIDKIAAKAKETGRYMVTISILNPDNSMDHHFIMQNFPGAEMLNASFEHERLVRKEKAKLDLPK